MQHKKHLSRLMRLSWEIQRRKRCPRAKALQSAWAIAQNEDITVYYLIRRHSHDRYKNKVQPHELGLFNNIQTIKTQRP